jgi:hypothetical protein
MIVFLLVLVIGGYAVESRQVPAWAYALTLIGAGARAAYRWKARQAQRRAEAEEAAKARRDDEITARCERNGGHEGARPPRPGRPAQAANVRVTRPILDTWISSARRSAVSRRGSAVAGRYVEARAHLIRAVSALATGPEDLRGRLWRVYPVLSNIRAADLPEPLRGDFEWVMEQLTAHPPRIFSADRQAEGNHIRTIT